MNIFKKMLIDNTDDNQIQQVTEELLNPVLFKLTDEQTAVMDNSVESIGKGRSVIIKGSAGTGKTTVVPYIIKQLSIKHICIAAPTWKALRVVRVKIGDDDKLDFNTVAYLSGLSPNANLDYFDPNNVKFKRNTKQSAERIGEYKLIIIDEGSMIKRVISKFLFDMSKETNVIFLVLGDEFQLPPVKETMSFSLREHEGFDIYTLTTIIRQKADNKTFNLITPLLNDIINEKNLVNDIIKETFDVGTTTDEWKAILDNYKYTEIKTSDKWFDVLANKPSDITKETGGYICLSTHKFNDVIKQYFRKEELKDNIDYIKYIAYTNENVQIYNTLIKTAIDKHNTICKGNYLLGYKDVRIGDTKVLGNSDEFIVEDTQPHIQYYKKNVAGCLILTKKLTEITIEGQLCKLKNLFDNKIITIFIPSKTATNHELIRREHLKYFVPNYKGMNLIQSMRKYYPKHMEFFNGIVLSTDIVIVDKKTIKKNIDFAYGITVHKSQGSTYKCSFIDIKNILDTSNMIMSREQNNLKKLLISINTKQMIYTALTRSSHINILNIK